MQDYYNDMREEDHYGYMHHNEENEDSYNDYQFTSGGKGGKGFGKGKGIFGAAKIYSKP